MIHPYVVYTFRYATSYHMHGDIIMNIATEGDSDGRV